MKLHLVALDIDNIADPSLAWTLLDAKMLILTSLNYFFLALSFLIFLVTQFVWNVVTKCVCVYVCVCVCVCVRAHACILGRGTPQLS